MIFDVDQGRMTRTSPISIMIITGETNCGKSGDRRCSIPREARAKHGWYIGVHGSEGSMTMSYPMLEYAIRIAEVI